MARVTSPLFSFDASGQVGKSIVYSKWKGRDYVRKYVVPKNPHALAQTFQRSYFAALVYAWTFGLETDTPEDWNALATSEQLSPFNAYMKFNLTRLSNGEPYASAPDFSGTEPDATTADIVANSPGPNKLHVTVEPNDPMSNHALGILTLGTPGGINTTADSIHRCIGHYVGGGSDIKVIDVANIPAGTYFLSFNVMNAAGLLQTWTHTSTGIVVANPV